MQPRLPLIAAASLLLLVLPASAAPPKPLPCEGRQVALGINEFTCAIAPAAGVRRVRVTAAFAGVHDDSEATLSAQLNGAAVRCKDGSRVQLRGEDGGDMLMCHFDVDGTAGSAAGVLTLRLTWHHAEPAGLTMTQD